MEILSLRDNPDLQEWFLLWFREKWDGDGDLDGCLESMESIHEAEGPLPQWYLLVEGRQIMGGLGMMPDGFYMRPELSPWLVALYVAPEYRGHGYGELLIRRSLEDAARLGFEKVYLCTKHEGYYERFGFSLREVCTDDIWKYRVYEINV